MQTDVLYNFDIDKHSHQDSKRIQKMGVQQTDEPSTPTTKSGTRHPRANTL